jgi:formate C-acetyltransferase
MGLTVMERLERHAEQASVSDHVLRPGMEEYDRGQRLRKRVISVDPHICIERARIITRVYKATEGEPVYARRAKALDQILRGMEVYILDDELIVGHQAEKQRSAPLFPEFAVEWVNQEIDTFQTRPQDRFIATEDVKREFREEIFPYWRGKTLSDRVYAHVTEEIRLQRYVATVFSVGIHEDGGLGHVALDYGRALTLGLEGIKERIRENLSTMRLSRCAIR